MHLFKESLAAARCNPRCGNHEFILETRGAAQYSLLEDVENSSMLLGLCVLPKGDGKLHTASIGRNAPSSSAQLGELHALAERDRRRRAVRGEDTIEHLCHLSLPALYSIRHSSEGYRGILLTDGYEAYERVAQALRLTHAGCFAHVRRKFDEARKAQGQHTSDSHAKIALQFIRELYLIEKSLRQISFASRWSDRPSE